MTATSETAPPFPASVQSSEPAMCPWGRFPCPMPEANRTLCHWPHRCVYLGDGVQAWLVGVTAQTQPLTLLLDASLTLVVTHGEAEISHEGAQSSLSHGQVLTLPSGSKIAVQSKSHADVLMLLNETKMKSAA